MTEPTTTTNHVYYIFMMNVLLLIEIMFEIIDLYRPV